MPDLTDHRLFVSAEQHRVAAQVFAQELRRAPGKVRLAKRTSNLFRARTHAGVRLSTDSFTRTLRVDTENGFADVQGMCTFEDFTDACLLHGCMPAVVPELKTITIGGAVSGIGIEATSFRYGLVHETVEQIEVLCGDGEIRICRADNEHADLFRAIPNSYGTLGYILSLRCKVVPVQSAVRACYTHFADRDAFLQALSDRCQDVSHDFVEGVRYAPGEYVLVSAQHCSDPVDASNAGSVPYYRLMAQSERAVLSVRDWIWRWDPDWFWCSRFYGMENPLLRRLSGRWMLRSSRYWKILNWYRRHRVEERLTRVRRWLGLATPLAEPVIQDVEIPMENCSAFMDFYEQVIDIRPMWICPLRPLGDAAKWTLYSMEPGRLYLNFGFWQSVPTDESRPKGFFNRLLENEVASRGGRKSLYSECFYGADEFWAIYNGAAYAQLKKRYDPGNRFLDLYQKTVQRR